MIITYIIIIGITILRNLMSQYDYQEINADSIKPGMILSHGAVFQWTNSNVKGLPQFTTEDLQTKLSIEQCIAIKEWASTFQTEKKVYIVRKIPFAIFILLGYITYILVGVFI